MEDLYNENISDDSEPGSSSISFSFSPVRLVIFAFNASLSSNRYEFILRDLSSFLLFIGTIVVFMASSLAAAMYASLIAASEISGFALESAVYSDESFISLSTTSMNLLSFSLANSVEASLLSI